MKRSYQLPFIMFIFLIFPFTVHADELSDLRETVARQQGQIDSLYDKISQSESEHVSSFGWNLGIFGDINYSTKSRELVHDSFYIDGISLYSRANYGERLNFLTEIAFEHEEADLERVWIGYSFSDLLQVRAGKFHSALGYWNKTYHHGKQLYETVARPFFLAFEHDGGVMPMHITGVEISGSMALETGRLKYEFELGNGPGITANNMLDSNISSDDNSSKQPVLRMSIDPSAVQGLSMGVFATNFKVNGVDETIYGADIYYKNNDFEFITEGFLFHNSDGDGSACYGQLSYDYGVWTPYFRYERLEVQGSDPYFASIRDTGKGIGTDRSQTILGLRYDIEPVNSSIKAQYRRDDAGKDYDVFETQWAFHF